MIIRCRILQGADDRKRECKDLLGDCDDERHHGDDISAIELVLESMQRGDRQIKTSANPSLF